MRSPRRDVPEWAWPVLYALVYVAVGYTLHARFFPVGDLGVESDFYAELAPAAQALARGEISPSDFPYKGPLHPLALAAVHVLVGDWYRSGVLLNLACAAGSIVLLAGLSSRLFGRAVGWGSVVILSLVGEFFLQSHKASSDLLFFFLFYATVALALKTHFSWRRLATIGALSGLTFLTRYNGLITPVTAVAVVLFLSDGWTWRARARGSALLLGSFLLFALPWVIWTFVETGHAPGHRNLQNVVEAFYPASGGRAVPAGGFSSVWQLVAHDPLYFVVGLLRNAVTHYGRDMGNLLGVSLGFVTTFGLLRWGFVRPSRGQLAFLLFPAASFVALLTVFHLPRFSLPVLPLYCVAAAGVLTGRELSVLSLARRVPRPAGSRPAPAVAAASLAVIVLALQVRIIRDLELAYYRSCPFYVPRAAVILREHALRRGDPGSLTVMARTAHIAHYAGLTYQRYPLAKIRDSQVLRFATDRDVDFIVYGAIEQRYFRESAFLSQLESLAGVEKIAEDPFFNIYEITPGAGVESDEGRAEVAALEERIAMAAAAGDPGAALTALADLARLHSAEARWDLVIEVMQRSATIADGLEGQAERAQQRSLIRTTLMRAYLEVGDHERGAQVTLEYLQDPSAKEPRDEANAHGLLARHYSELGRIGAAIEHLRVARDMYAALGDSAEAETMENVIRFLEGKRDRR